LRRRLLLRELAGLEPRVGRLAALERGKVALAIAIIGLGVGELLGGDEAAPASGLFALILAARLVEREIGLEHRALVGEPGLGERQLLAAHIVDLLLDFGLARERRELELGVGEQGDRLALRDGRAVLDEHLLDPAALDRVDIDGEQRRDARAQRNEIVERAARDRRDGDMVGADGLARSRRREPPEQQRREQHHHPAIAALTRFESFRVSTTWSIPLAGYRTVSHFFCIRTTPMVMTSNPRASPDRKQPRETGHRIARTSVRIRTLLSEIERQADRCEAEPEQRVAALCADTATSSVACGVAPNASAAQANAASSGAFRANFPDSFPRHARDPRFIYRDSSRTRAKCPSCFDAEEHGCRGVPTAEKRDFREPDRVLPTPCVAACRIGTQIDCPESYSRCTGVDGMGSGPEFDYCVVIDDDDDILMASRLLLRRLFSRCRHGPQPDEALPLVEARTPDVVLLDANFARGATDAPRGSPGSKSCSAWIPRWWW
jgi:hypothetical protein